MPTTFPEYTLEDARKIVNDRYDAAAQEAVAFYNGDHWQEGVGWIGPQYDTDHRLYKSTMSAIERSFISHNVVGELTERHVSGVLGRELHWKFSVIRSLEPVPQKDPNTGQPITNPLTGEPVMTEGQPSEQELGLIDEAEAALVEWWNERNVLETLKHALAGLLLTKRAALRFSIPPGLRDEQGNLPAVDLAGALGFLYLDHMGYDEDLLEQVLPTATVWTDKNSRRQAGIFTYTDEDTQEERGEMTYVDNDRNTVLRTFNGRGDLEGAVGMPLGGRLLMYEMTRKALITPQIMSQQKSLNKTLTMKDRNDTQGGFLERYLLNIKWPGTQVVKEDGTTEFVPDPMYTGPGTLNSLQGQTYTDETGVTHVMNPSVQFRDPVSAQTFIDSADHTYLGMLREGNQLHYSIAGEGVVSGESRKQARDAYTKDLQNSANTVEGAVRWILETGLSLASYLAGQPNRFEGLRVYAQAKIDSGPLSPDDMRVAAEMFDRGLWDKETAISATGVDDVDAILQRMETERLENERRAVAFEEEFGSQGEEDEEEEEEAVVSRNSNR